MAEVTPASRVKLSDDVLFQDLQGDAVLLELKTGVYFGLDRIGSRMWQLLGEGGTLAEVAGTMSGEYDVSEDKCRQDVLLLVQQLHEQGLLELI